jgi:hypothetical protein
MAQFVHLASAKNAAAIRRSGIKPHRFPKWPARGVYAMPVTSNFFVSHQWLRELKRDGQRSIVGIYFRIGDNEPVLIGHYRYQHRQVTANQAVGLVMHAKNAEGYEVIIPRKIEATEIRRVRALPQVLGWRYYPDAHGKKPCGCPFCQSRGEIKSRKIRDAYEKSQQ